MLLELLTYSPIPQRLLLSDISLVKIKKKAEDVSNFIEMVGTWFDIMNSYILNASVPTKRPYGGINIEEQNNTRTLNKVKSAFATMRCQRKNVLQIFQKGVYISTSSLQDLYVDITAKYGIKYILTLGEFVFPGK